MNKIWDKDKRIILYGSKKDIDTAIRVLDDVLSSGGGSTKLVFTETEHRKTLSMLIIEYNLKASILYDGNTVWNTDKLCKDVKRVVKGGMTKMTDYLYKFLSLDCGSIAHFNKQGWIAEYSTVDDLREFFKCNEFGNRVLDHHPNWYYDAKKADWKNSNELKQQYKSASIVGEGRVVFNIKGNTYRLVVSIDFEFQVIFIRFIGTHEQYDKINAKTI